MKKSFSRCKGKAFNWQLDRQISLHQNVKRGIRVASYCITTSEHVNMIVCSFLFLFLFVCLLVCLFVCLFFYIIQFKDGLLRYRFLKTMLLRRAKTCRLFFTTLLCPKNAFNITEKNCS